jgi:hypothetical protein
VTLLEEPRSKASPEALIKEARRRQHLRWLAAFMGILVIAATVAGIAASLGGSSARSSPVPVVTRPPQTAAHAKPKRAEISTAPGQPQDLAFVDAEHGWIVEARPCPNGLNGCGSLIEATTDGGRTWTTQYKGPGELDEVSFTSPNVGWAWGGACDNDVFFDQHPASPNCRDTLVETTDGTTWRPVVAPPDADKFVFTDYLHGWAATYACDYLENGDSMNVQPRTCPSTVFSTDNAGRTWVPNLHLEDSVIAIGILDSSPVIVEQEVPPTIEGTDSLLIVRGDPTGSTWTELSRVPVSVGTINLLVSLEFESDGSGWIDVFTTGAGCGGGGCQEQIDVTRDAGRVWTALDGLDQILRSSRTHVLAVPVA